MGKRRKKRDPKLIGRWIVALLCGTVLVWLAARCLAPATASALPGIDVSAHQGQIRWQEVADSGVTFAMIRLGYRGYEDGALHIDHRARENLEQARAAGLKVGAYFFSQALTAEEARQEAELALAVLDGMELDLPLAYDWETVSGDARTAHMDPQTLTACVHGFCERIRQAGYAPMVYFNRQLSQTLLEPDRLEGYPFWYAQYAPEPELDRPIRMWQWTDRGSVPGIDVPTDLDWWWP